MGKSRRYNEIMGNSGTKVNVRAGSHLPVLYKLLQATDGAVLELGAGWNSTPLLYWICKVEGREFQSYENDKEWINALQYPVKYASDWEWVDGVGEFWSIALVDHKPARKRRSSAKKLKDRARFVVLHDSELANHPAYKYTPIYDEFKYRYEYKKTTPHTMVLSNFEDPTPILT